MNSKFFGVRLIVYKPNQFGSLDIISDVRILQGTRDEIEKQANILINQLYPVKEGWIHLPITLYYLKTA